MIDFLINVGFKRLFNKVSKQIQTQQQTQQQLIKSHNFNGLTNIFSVKTTKFVVLDQTQRNYQTPLNLNVNKFISLFLQSDLELFEKHNVIVAGSTVLKFITNKTFKNNDIDIYIKQSDFSKLCELNNLTNSNDLANLTNSNRLFELESSNSKFINVTSVYNMKGIVSVYKLITKRSQPIKYKSKYNKYQLIVVSEDPANFIKDNFDFDLCAIGFDFASKSFINIIEKQNYNFIKIQQSYFDKMTGPEADSYSNYRANKTIQRIFKYAGRNFIIENWEDFLIEVRDKICNH
jgi:hypothetical protein